MAPSSSSPCATGLGRRRQASSASNSCLNLLLLLAAAACCARTTTAFLQLPTPSGALRAARPVLGARAVLPQSSLLVLHAGKRGGGGGKYDSQKKKQAHQKPKGLGRTDAPATSAPPSPPSSSPDPRGMLWEGGDEDEDEEEDEDVEEEDAEVLEFQGLMDRGAFQLLDENDVEIDEKYDMFDEEDEEGREGEFDSDDDEEEEEEGDGRPKNDPEWQFFDTAKVYVKGGDGGDGCVAFRREKYVDMGGPNGGSGGGGGSVYFQCDEGLNTLAGLRAKVHWKALGGGRGQGKSRTGPSAQDIIVDVPPGTIVRTLDGTLAGQLVEHEQKVLVARGGRGGRGNEQFKSERNNAPKLMEKGEPGAERWLQVELKLVADVGFVGVPNAGKSTLLAAVSNARPKIADYPFTTIVPNLGVWDASETVKGEWVEKGMVLADIPGLLEGAHQGVGLGLAFLRHVQRCRVLVHVVNGDSRDPVGDFVAINQELALFNPKLAEKPQVVVLNKIDLIDPETQAELEKKLKEVIPHTRFMSISAIKKTNTAELMHRVWKMLKVIKDEDEDLLNGEVPIQLDEQSFRMSYQIITDPKFPGQFRVQGKQIEKICAMTNWDYYEAVERFQRILEATGIAKTLKKRGAKEGDLIMIGDRDFDYTRETNAFAAAANDIRTWDSEQHYDGSDG